MSGRLRSIYRLSLKVEAVSQPSSSSGNSKRADGPAARPPITAQAMSDVNAASTMGTRFSIFMVCGETICDEIACQSMVKTMILSALINPTINEGTRICNRLRSPDETSTATSPPKVKKSRIS